MPVYIDLPLFEPATAMVCDGLEGLGFIFAGLLPEWFDSGDALRLQYLNNVSLDLDQLKTATALGRELVAYVGQYYEADQ